MTFNILELPETPENKDSAMKILPKTFNSLLHLAIDPPSPKGWVYSSTKKNVFVETRSIPGKNNAIRGSADIPYHAIDILNAWRHIENTNNWDSYLDTASILETVTPSARIVNMQHKSSWGVASRFTLAMRACRFLKPGCLEFDKSWKPQKKGWISSAGVNIRPIIPLKQTIDSSDLVFGEQDPESVNIDKTAPILVSLFSLNNYPKITPQSNQVVCNIMSTGFLMVPIGTLEKPLTRVIYVANVNLGGSLPKILQNQVNTDIPLIIRGISNFLDNNKPTATTSSEKT